MRFFYSGGSPIPESNLKDPDVMLSYFVNIRKNTAEPDARLGRLIKIRRKKMKRRKK